jgi:hypothetical protein
MVAPPLMKVVSMLKPFATPCNVSREQGSDGFLDGGEYVRLFLKTFISWCRALAVEHDEELYS